MPGSPTRRQVLSGTPGGVLASLRFGVTGVLAPGTDNVIAVRVTNARDTDIAPVNADYSFASDGRNEGGRPGIDDKGLVTHDRQIRKDAFYWYKANWATTPTLHITSRRWTRRTDAHTELKVHSDADEVTATLNGTPLGDPARRRPHLPMDRRHAAGGREHGDGDRDHQRLHTPTPSCGRLPPTPRPLRLGRVGLP